jgi:hypothetical protein
MSHPCFMRSLTWRVLAVVCAASVLAGCGGGSDAAVDEAPLVADAGSTTTSAVDPWAIPEVIDAEYVRRVLQRIDDVRAEVRRDVFATKQFTDVDRKKIESIYVDHQLVVALNEWPTLATTEHPDFLSNPGSAVVVVQRILRSTSDCIWADVTFDESKNRPTPRVPVQAQIVLVVAAHDTQVNPTPWMIRRKTVPGELEPVQACG